MKDRQIEHKVINGLLKQGYQPDKAVLEDIRKTIVRESTDKYHPYYILGLVCDYGFYLGVKGTQFEVPLQIYTQGRVGEMKTITTILITAAMMALITASIFMHSSNHLNMSNVTDFRATDTGLMLYTEDGAGWYWER